MSARGVFVALWFVAACAVGWFDAPVSARVVLGLCLLAAATMGLGHGSARRSGFDAGYRLAARRAVDLVRLAALRESDRALGAALSKAAEDIRIRLEIEGERDS